MEYYSPVKRNTLESVLMRWMNLKPIIHGEVNQKEKDKYSILTHIFNLYACIWAKSRVRRRGDKDNGF